MSAPAPRPRRRFRRIAAGAVLAAAVGTALWQASLRPSHERVWAEPQAVLPQVRFEDSLVHVAGVRDFAYRTADEYTPAYRQRSYDLRRLDRAWLVVSPFGTRWRGPAHVFLSFGFSDGTFVSVSVEARREAGEAYSLAKGMLRRFELMYVVAEERDAIGLRAVAWDAPVHLYPIRAEPARIRAVFLEMMRRADGISRRPEFYNTLTNNCTTNILDPVNAVAARPIRYGPRILFPGYLDEVAFERGLVDTPLEMDEARAAFRVNDRARAAFASDADFSRAIRGE